MTESAGPAFAGTSPSAALTGKTSIVTGGGSGLGEATARRLGDEGSRVVVADIDGDAAKRVAASITDSGGDAVAVQCDVRRHLDVRDMVAVAVAADAPLQVVVLSAAIERRAGVVECSDADWQEILEVNLKGPFLCMREAIPAMVAAGGGSVIALGSTLGQIGSPQYAAYCASKGALNNLCKQAAIEHAADRVRVNVVAPSATDTGLFFKMTEATDDPPGLRERIGAAMPMRRLARTEEVCDAILWLASAASSYVSGTVLPVDGGLAARRM
jgi:NAD(P)-dependent dehydrogenase (short-subunit alcohol dehydrogenase family)